MNTVTNNRDALVTLIVVLAGALAAFSATMGWVSNETLTAVLTAATAILGGYFANNQKAREALDVVGQIQSQLPPTPAQVQVETTPSADIKVVDAESTPPTTGDAIEAGGNTDATPAQPSA